MKIKYILAGAFVAMLAVPGTASQLAIRNAVAQPLLPVLLAASTAGAFSDPSQAPKLSIELPTRFVALDIGDHPLASFHG